MARIGLGMARVGLRMTCVKREMAHISFGTCQPRNRQHTVGQNNQESRLQYWVTHSSVRSFARTAHSLLSTTRFAWALCCAHSLACSLCSLPRSWESEWLDGYLFCVFFYSGHLCNIGFTILLFAFPLTESARSILMLQSNQARNRCKGSSQESRRSFDLSKVGLHSFFYWNPLHFFRWIF